MDSVEVVYYTCLNNECPKHRNVFREGDPQHENCARERLWLEGQRADVPRWLWFAIPVALAMIVAGATLAVRKMRAADFKPPMLREEKKTWSGAQTHREEREGHPVPPPIST
jgi:hypothetical protein